jgi:hypothetical protein
MLLAMLMVARAPAFAAFGQSSGVRIVHKATAAVQLTQSSAKAHGLSLVSPDVLFPGHLLCFEHFFPCPRQPSPATAVENDRLTRAVKN